MKRAITLYNRIKTDKKYRQIFTVFGWSCGIFLVLGWNIGQGGPTLLDLQIVANCTLEEASLFFTAIATGYLVSSFVVSQTFDRFDKFLHIIFGNIGVAAVMATIPWSSYYELMFTMHVLKGFTCGFADAVVATLLIHLLGQDVRTYIQILHLFFTIGGILSPLSSSPFITQTGDTWSNRGAINTTSVINFYSTNVTTTYQQRLSTDPSLHAITNNSIQGTEIYKAYSISAGLTLLSVLPFIVIYFKYDKSLTVSKVEQTDTTEQTNTLPIKLRVLVFMFIALTSAVFTAMEDSFAGFLSPFAVKQFGWDEVVASYVTSVYWACFGGGSLFAIFIAPLFLLSKFLCFYSFMVVSSFVCLLITSLNGVDAGVWIAACMNGFFMSVFFPLFYAWVEEDFLNVTAKVNALIMISASVGVIINPVIIGQLMQKAPIYFCYILLGESVLLLLVYIIGILLSKKTKHLRRFSKCNINITVSDITAGHILSDTQINKSSEITKF